MFMGLLDYRDNIGDGVYHHNIVDFWIFKTIVFGFQKSILKKNFHPPKLFLG
jgi:hypothetical protein